MWLSFIISLSRCTMLNWRAMYAKRLDSMQTASHYTGIIHTAAGRACSPLSPYELLLRQSWLFPQFFNFRWQTFQPAQGFHKTIPAASAPLPISCRHSLFFFTLQWSIRTHFPVPQQSPSRNSRLSTQIRHISKNTCHMNSDLYARGPEFRNCTILFTIFVGGLPYVIQFA